METMSERIARIYIAKQKDQGLPKKYLSGFKGKERTERTKEIKKRQFEDYKEKLYGVEVKKGGFIAKGCGKVMNDRRKVTKMY